jgi:hypothetical protein
MSLNLIAYRNRKCVRTLTITESDGTNAVVEAVDDVICRIGRGGTVLLTVSKTATDNGSSTTAANPSTLTLAAADITLKPGAYDMDLLVKDSSEANAEKAVERGVLTVLETQ